MTGEEDGRRDLARLVVPRCGLLEATGDPFEPYRLVDADGVVVGPVAVYLRELRRAAARHHAAVLRDGPAALVPFPVGGGDRVGPGHPGGGPGFLPVDPAGGQAGPGAPGTGGARVRRGGKEAVNPVTGNRRWR